MSSVYYALNITVSIRIDTVFISFTACTYAHFRVSTITITHTDTLRASVHTEELRCVVTAVSVGCVLLCVLFSTTLTTLMNPQHSTQHSTQQRNARPITSHCIASYRIKFPAVSHLSISSQLTTNRHAEKYDICGVVNCAFQAAYFQQKRGLPDSSSKTFCWLASPDDRTLGQYCILLAWNLLLS